jgi:hypothetical protein
MIEFLSNTIEINQDGLQISIWRFLDMNGNTFVTETPIDGTEEEAAIIILGSIASE